MIYVIQNVLYVVDLWIHNVQAAKPIFFYIRLNVCLYVQMDIIKKLLIKLVLHVILYVLYALIHHQIHVKHVQQEII